MLKKIFTGSLFHCLLITAFSIFKLLSDLNSSLYSPLASENAKHLAKAYEMLYKLEHGFSAADALNTITYPPYFYLNTVIWFKALGLHSEAAAILSVSFFTAAASLSVYFLTKQTSGKPAALAASLALSFFITASLSEEGYLIEYASAAWTAAAFFCINADREKTCFWVHVPLTAFCLVSGLLCKWNFFTYLIPSVFCLLINCAVYFIKQRRASKIKLKIKLSKVFYILAAAVLSIWILSLWYGARHGSMTNLQEMFRHYNNSRSSELQIHNTDKFHEESFRSKCTGIAKWAPVSFALYLAMEKCPLYITLLMLISAAAAGFSFYKRAADKNGREMLFTPADTALLTIIFIIFSYSFYPSQELFAPEQSMRHAAPLAPIAAYFAFCWMHRIKDAKIAAAILFFVLSCLSINIYQNNISKPEAVLQRVSSLRKISLQTAEAAQSYDSKYPVKNLPIILNLLNKEDFEPFFVEIYGIFGPSYILSSENGRLIWTNSLTQLLSREEKDRTNLKKAAVIQRVCQITDKKIERLQESDRISLKAERQEKSFTSAVYRSSALEIYKISMYEADI